MLLLFEGSEAPGTCERQSVDLSVGSSFPEASYLTTD